MSADTSTGVLNSPTLGDVGKKPMVKRTFYISAKLWEQAKALAEQEQDMNISDVMRVLVERYVKKGKL